MALNKGIIGWPTSLTEKQAEEVFALYPEARRINAPKCYYVRGHQRRKYESRPPAAREGWVKYPLPPDGVGNLTEHLDTLTYLVGSAQYESQTHEGQTYIRRA